MRITMHRKEEVLEELNKIITDIDNADYLSPNQYDPGTGEDAIHNLKTAIQMIEQYKCVDETEYATW